MKSRICHSILPICILLIFSTGAFAQSNDVKLIQQNFDRQVECWNKGDIECYVEAYVKSDSTRVISSQGVTYGYDAILDLFKQYWTKDNMGTLTFKGINMERLSKEHYFVTGHFDVALPDGNHHAGYFSAIMKKVNGAWRIYTDHS